MADRGWQFWVDRGGTFTDIVARSPDRVLLTHKLLSDNPARYADASVAGITLNINGAPGLDLTMEPGSILEADDVSGNDSAGDIVVVVSGDVLMKATSRISADNNNSGGSAGDITMTVAGNMTMCGVNASPAACSPTGSPGALISSQWLGNTATQTGESVITITVGSLDDISGDFFMGGGSTGYLTETGARVTHSFGPPPGSPSRVRESLPPSPHPTDEMKSHFSTKMSRVWRGRLPAALAVACTSGSACRCCPLPTPPPSQRCRRYPAGPSSRALSPCS